MSSSFGLSVGPRMTAIFVVCHSKCLQISPSSVHHKFISRVLGPSVVLLYQRILKSPLSPSNLVQLTRWPWRGGRTVDQKRIITSFLYICEICRWSSINLSRIPPEPQLSARIGWLEGTRWIYGESAFSDFTC